MFKNIFTEQVEQRVFGFVMSLLISGVIVGFFHVGLTILSAEAIQFAMENPAMTFLFPTAFLSLVISAILWNKK